MEKIAKKKKKNIYIYKIRGTNLALWHTLLQEVSAAHHADDALFEGRFQSRPPRAARTLQCFEEIPHDMFGQEEFFLSFFL